MLLRKLFFAVSLSLSLVLPALQAIAQDAFSSADASKVLGSGPAAMSQPANEFLPVEQAYQSLLQWRDGQLHISWTIADGYYLYQERFEFAVLENGEQTSLDVVLPEGKVKDDPYFGRTPVYYYNLNHSIDWPASAEPRTLVLTAQGCADAGLCYPPYTQYAEVDTQSGELRLSERPPATMTHETSTDSAAQSLLVMCLLAFLGGLILNLMPCVFPVLSLKVLGFTHQKGHSAAHGSVYALGVIVSFALVAGLLISLRQGGAALGWGFQLQTPWFVAALALLFFVLAGAMLGWLEIGARWMGIGNELSQQGGYSGSFFTGVLATVVASPCTAPFMGTALGYAINQPTLQALMVFIALGAGMAAPVWLLSLNPAWLKRLPQPGNWMIVLRQAMAFPLLATSIWLIWVVGRQSGADAMAILLGSCLLLGLSLWLGQQQTRKWPALATAALALAVLWHPSLHHPEQSRAKAGSSFDASQISHLRQSGKAVFLDITADWCITCKVNENLVLHTDAMQDEFEQAGVVYLVADWTRYDPAITELLDGFQRNGIPLYVLYPADATKPATVLPQILTADIVRQALDTL